MFWYARKPDDATAAHAGEDVQDEEDIETDEEDRGQHATDRSQTNVPLPTATDVTQASVEQLSTLAMSDESEDKKDATKGEAKESVTAPGVTAQSVAADKDKGKEASKSL